MDPSILYIKPGMEDDCIQEEQWLRDAQAGSAEAFTQLFKRHYPMTFHLAYRICGNRDDAAEIAQDVFIKLAGNLGQYEGRGSWKGWLYKITVNRTRDYQRKAGRYSEVQAAFAEEKAVESRTDETLLSERVGEMVRALPQSEREAIVLTYFEGLSHAEAARICGCAETTISWRVYQAKKVLKKKWKELNCEL